MALYGVELLSGTTPDQAVLFVQDSWRVTPRLTLNYGLRWEDYLPQSAAKPGGAGSFDPATGEVLVAGVGSVPLNMGVSPYNLGFAPRIGAAYRIRPNTVVRVGFGRSFSPGGLGAIFGRGADVNPPVVNPQFVSQANPYVSPFNLQNGPPSVRIPSVGSKGRYPLPNGINVYYYISPLNSYRIPEADFWNFTVQHEFPGNIALEVAYVANVGRQLFETLNENQAVPGPGDYDPRRPFYKFGLEQGIDQTCNCANSSYNSLQSKLQKRFSHGLDFFLTYTWAKALDTKGFSDSYNVRDSYGPADWDRTHTVTFEDNWELPFGRGRQWKLGGNRMAEALLGGWRLSGVHTFASGLPLTAWALNAPLLNTDFNSVRADIIGDPHVSNPNASQWFNPAAFTEPQQPYRNGTASRNSLRGPGLAVSNLSVAKSFVPKEGTALELRAEAFNVFNHVNLGLPNSLIDTSAAGQITSVQTAMRQMQVALHFQF